MSTPLVEGLDPAKWYRPPGSSPIAPLFLKLVSILVNGRRSALLRRSPRAISSVEAGSLLTCRKRNMLSGLKCEGRGISRARVDPRLRRTADSTYFFFIRAKLFSRFRGFIPRPTHDRLAALRQASRTFPERGKSRGGTTWPASLLLFSIISNTHLIYFHLSIKYAMGCAPLFVNVRDGDPEHRRDPRRARMPW
jgi:hypothetical protein